MVGTLNYEVPSGWRSSEAEITVVAADTAKAKKEVGDDTWTFFGLQLQIRNESATDFILHTGESSIVFHGDSHAVFLGSATLLDRNVPQQVPIPAQATTTVVLLDREYATGWTFSHRFEVGESKEFFQRKYEASSEAGEAEAKAAYAESIKERLAAHPTNGVTTSDLTIRLGGRLKGNSVTIVFDEVHDLKKGKVSRSFF